MMFASVFISLLHFQFRFLIDIHTWCNGIDDTYLIINSSEDIISSLAMPQNVSSYA